MKGIVMPKSKTYDNNMRGVLFKNTKKTRDNERGFDYNGNINVNGQDFNLCGWVNESSKGTKYISLKVYEKTDENTHTTNKQYAKATPVKQQVEKNVQVNENDLLF